jgi:hypothetical protein
MATPTLSLLAFPQKWDGTQLTLNILIVPVGDPTAPNNIAPTVSPAPPTPAFEKAKLALDGKLITTLNQMPDVTDPHTKSFSLGISTPSNLDAIYAEVKKSFHLDPAPPPPKIRPALTSIKKVLPSSYTSAFPFEQSRSPLATPDADFGCALRDPGSPAPKKKPAPSDLTTWGKIISMCLRQPMLARAMGLLYTGTIKPDPADVASGSWLYVALDTSSDYAGDVTGGQIAYYAARLPPLKPSVQRPLLGAVLFPVTNTAGGIPLPSGNFDDVFAEAETYDDGFTQIVHCSQPSVIDAASQDPNTLAAAADAGILIGWDDEQIPIWLQRQISDAPVDVDRRVPLGVLGYRVDVRRHPDTTWHSLQTVSGNLSLGPLAIGSANNTELQVETSPAKLRDVASGTQQDYWLPQYFTAWRGKSIVIGDDLAYKLSGAKTPPPKRQLTPVLPGVDLRYGEFYDFRVRIADLTGGGPALGDSAQNLAPAPVATWNFRRHVQPKSVIAKLPKPQPTALPSVDVYRPLLSYPEFVFAGDPTDPNTLLAKLSGPDKTTDIGVPDPDVVHLQITVEAKLPAQDAGTATSPWRGLFITTRDFPSDSSQPIPLQFDYQDQPELTFADTPPHITGTGPVTLPTARDVRVRLAPVCKEDPTGTRFASDAVRTGLTFDIAVRKESDKETGLFTNDPDARRLNAIYLQPDLQATPNQGIALALLGAVNPGGATTGTSVIERLAAQLDLAVSGMTLSGRAGHRVVFGASGALRHTLASDNSSITFGSNNDLLGHWIAALRLEIARDWTWDGLSDKGIEISRAGAGAVGAIQVKRAIAPTALQATPLRDHTELVFFDAIDPTPDPGQFPAELNPKWKVTASLDGTPTVDAPIEIGARLPVTVTPAQVPSIASVGVALSDYVHSPDYSQTEPRQRMLWIEFTDAIKDPEDAYFGRVLAYAPDPLLVPGHKGASAPSEPALPIDPELIRVIIPGQSEDFSGLTAMQQLIASSSPKHFLLPLPDGLDASSPELFGFFTYELRVGHVNEWSTAQGRFGRPLRITGVQHPAPTLDCLVNHGPTGILVQSAFASPVTKTGQRANGPDNILEPQTQLWALLYSQVMQADGATNRNVLLDRKAVTLVRNDKNQKALYATRDLVGRTHWSQDEVKTMLGALCLAPDSPLSVLAVELLQEAKPPADPLGIDLGRMRILRTSPLVPVPAICI